MAEYITFQPSDHFNAKLYTGTGSSNAITGVGYQPDLVWIKGRSNAPDHFVFDAIRGVTNSLRPNVTSTTYTEAQLLTAFDSDGFTVGTNSNVNGSSQTFVSWNWKFNGSGSSNTDGSVTSTVSVNTTAGFSIVKWTADLSNVVTVGHGLGTTPKVIIQKAIDQTSGWVTGGFGLDWSGYVSLDATNAFNNNNNDSTGTGRFFSAGGTEPSSTVFSTNSSALTGSATDVIAYCFAEKKGFSKFGTYTGNGNDDGPFIYTGFRPAFVMIKSYSGGTGQWLMFDNKRNDFNVVNKFLKADDSAAEGTSATANKVDFCSNGIKIRENNGDLNLSSSVQYLYMAFAEHPLVSSNDIPATAR